MQELHFTQVKYANLYIAKLTKGAWRKFVYNTLSTLRDKTNIFWKFDLPKIG